MNNKGILKKYNVSIDSDNRTLTLDYDKKISIPDKVQGVSFYKKANDIYIIFSRSYGEKIPSVLQIFKYNEDVTNYNDTSLNYVCLECPSMLEQTAILDNYIYSVYESAAFPYKSADSTNNLTVVDVDIVLMKLKNNDTMN